MDCVQTDTTATTLLLLTHADKVSELQKQLKNHTGNAGIFLPDENFYQKISSSEDVERMADTLFKWLGIKHKSIRFRIDSNQNDLVIYEKVGKYTRATLGWRCLKDPFLCGAALAHAILHHILLSRRKIRLENTDENETLTDLATIYAGFGIVIMNGLSDGTPVLGNMAPANYIAEFLDYVSDQQIVSGVWQPYVLPNVLSPFVTYDPVYEPAPYVTAFLQKRRAAKRKLFALISLSFIIISAAALYVLYQPRQLSAELAEQRDRVNVLKTQYAHCEETVRYKETHWDTSDIFIVRQIDADKTRCASLKSRYNFELNAYNTRINP